MDGHSKLRGRRATPGPGQRGPRAASSDSAARSRSRRSSRQDDVQDGEADSKSRCRSQSPSPTRSSCSSASTSGRGGRSHRARSPRCARSPARPTPEAHTPGQSQPDLGHPGSQGTDLGHLGPGFGPGPSCSSAWQGQGGQGRPGRPQRLWSPTPQHSPQRGRVFGPLSAATLHNAQSKSPPPTEQLRSSLKKTRPMEATTGAAASQQADQQAGPPRSEHQQHQQHVAARSAAVRRIRFVLATTDVDVAEVEAPPRGVTEGSCGDAACRLRGGRGVQCRHDGHHARPGPGPGPDFGGLPGGGEPPHLPPFGVRATLPGAAAGDKRTAVPGVPGAAPRPATRGQLVQLEPPGVDAASRLLSRCALTGHQAGTAGTQPPGNDSLVHSQLGQGSAAPTDRRDSW